MSQPFNGKLADPEWRKERARKAARAAVEKRTSVDTHIRALVDAAPALTDEQIAKLRQLLPPLEGGTEGATAVPTV